MSLSIFCMRGIDFFLKLACECIYYIPSLEVHPSSGREEVQWLIIASKIEVKRLYQGRGCYSGFSEFYCHYHFLLVKSSDPFIDSIPICEGFQPSLLRVLRPPKVIAKHDVGEQKILYIHTYFASMYIFA